MRQASPSATDLAACTHTRSPPDKSINFTSGGGSGSVSFNNRDLSQLLVRGDTSSTLTSILDRLDALERGASAGASSDAGGGEAAEQEASRPASASPATLADVRSTLDQILGTGSARMSAAAVRRAIRKVSQLQSQVTRLAQLLTRDECSSDPCRNGGSCVDLFNGFVCRCPPQFEGRTCETDVNECSAFAGTDLGCQNGASCRNSHGGYSCVCPVSAVPVYSHAVMHG